MYDESHSAEAVQSRRADAMSICHQVGLLLAEALETADTLFTPLDDDGTCLLDYLLHGQNQCTLASGQTWDNRTAALIAYSALSGSSLYPASIILQGQTPG